MTAHLMEGQGPSGTATPQGRAARAQGPVLLSSRRGRGQLPALTTCPADPTSSRLSTPAEPRPQTPGEMQDPGEAPWSPPCRASCYSVSRASGLTALLVPGQPRSHPEPRLEASGSGLPPPHPPSAGSAEPCVGSHQGRRGGVRPRGSTPASLPLSPIKCFSHARVPWTLPFEQQCF